MGCFKDQGDPQGTSGRDLSGHMFLPPLWLRSAPNTTAAVTGAVIDQPAPASSRLRMAPQPAPVMSASACTAGCRARGFAFAGTQYSSYCFCGNRFGQTGTSASCNMPCTGNPGEICGGAWANSVYWTGIGAPPAHGWTGSARCQVDVRGTGYSDSRTHTWTFVGDPTSQTATTQIYNAVWAVTGSGSKTSATGSAQWTVNGGASGPMSVLVRPNGNRADLLEPHANANTAKRDLRYAASTGQTRYRSARSRRVCIPDGRGCCERKPYSPACRTRLSCRFLRLHAACGRANHRQCSWSFNLIP